MRYHLWYKPALTDKNGNPIDVTPIRRDLGVVVGWDPFFLPYLRNKVDILNHGGTTWYIGDSEGNPV
jgi:hypothetical protein